MLLVNISFYLITIACLLVKYHRQSRWLEIASDSKAPKDPRATPENLFHTEHHLVETFVFFVQENCSNVVANHVNKADLI